MKKVFLSVFLAGGIVIIAGCLPEDWDADLFRRKPPHEPEYLDYLERVRSQPLDFQILGSDDAKAWSRAQYISKKYSRTLGGGRKLLISSNDIIEIAPRKYNITKYQATGYLYRIARAPRGDMTDYKVSYSSPSPDYAGDEFFSQKNRACARIIAYYIVSGRLYKRAMDYPELARLQ